MKDAEWQYKWEEMCKLESMSKDFIANAFDGFIESIKEPIKQIHIEQLSKLFEGSKFSVDDLEINVSRDYDYENIFICVTLGVDGNAALEYLVDELCMFFPYTFHINSDNDRSDNKERRLGFKYCI
jgi:hypothetical protein